MPFVGSEKVFLPARSYTVTVNADPMPAGSQTLVFDDAGLGDIVKAAALGAAPVLRAMLQLVGGGKG